MFLYDIYLEVDTHLLSLKIVSKQEYLFSPWKD